MSLKYEALFKPFKIGNLEIKNRICMAPMLPNGWLDENKNVTDETINYYAERAKHGVGLIIVGASFPDADLEKANFNKSPFAVPEEFIVKTKKLTEAVHRYGAKLFFQIQLGSGRTGFPAASPGVLPIAPSPVRNRWDPNVICRELTKEEIKRLIDATIEGAVLSKQAGCDGININGVKGGYLGDQFATDAFNHRTDEYGGSLENKIRIITEIVKGIKEKCGPDFPVTTRLGTKAHMKAEGVGQLPGEEYTEYGRDLEESLKIGKMLEEAGFDAILFGTGTYDSLYWLYPPMYMPEGTYLEEAQILKKALNIPVICPGKLSDPDLANKAVEEGLIDALSLGRGLVADAEWADKVKRGDTQNIRPCIYCNNGCLARVLSGLSMQCAVNPDVFNETKLAEKYSKVPIVKRVSIIGGGIAGMEAARVAASRGHKVTIYEAGKELGGLVVPAHVPDFKFRDKLLLDWYKLQLEKLDVEVILNKKMSVEDILNLDTDEIVIATGSTAKTIEIPGGQHEKVVTAVEALTASANLGKRIVLVGGGQVGIETAVWLKEKGHEVSIVEAREGLLLAPVEPIAPPNLQMLQELVVYHNIPVYLNSIVKEFTGSQVTIKSKDGDVTIEADNIVLSIGYTANDTLFKEVYARSEKKVWLVGDAQKPGTIMTAIRDGSAVGAAI
ncbi:MAG: FAD-dependent oxidoreductase [Clostridiales bacterium]|nr:FAD-dependent oxidoreductase [Clostridiales bacterium]